MKTKITVILGVVFFLSAEVLATPIYGSVTMSSVGYGAKDTMTIWGGGWNGLNVYAGIYMFDKTAGTGDGQYLDNGYIGGFCMDLSEYIAPGSLNYDVIMLEDGPRPYTFLGGAMGEEKAAYISELWGRYYDSAWSAGGSYTAQQKSDAEAFAAAVWEIIYEDLPTSSAGWDVTVDGTFGSKGFKAQNLDYQTANNWLHSLDGTGPMAELISLSYCGSQDFIVEIPEPATIAFVSLGLLVLVGRKGHLQTA